MTWWYEAPTRGPGAGHRPKPAHARARLALLVGLLAIGGGCGDEPATMNAPPPPPPHQRNLAAAGHGAAAPAEKVGKLRPHPPWNSIKKFFLGAGQFARGPVGSIRDPFEPQLVKFVPRSLEAPEAAGTDRTDEGPLLPEPEPIVAEPVAVQRGETEKFRAQDYRLLLIRWGTSVNKALVQDPEGSIFEVTPDMKLGNNNGRVIEITQYDVRVQEDSRNDPIVLSIQPSILKIEERTGPTARLYTNQPGG